MGIPFYFKKLFTLFGKKILQKVPLGATCHTLYLDFNCLIHQCANTVVSKSPYLSQAEYEPLVIDQVILGVLSLVNVVRPTHLLYIGVDGLCPKAKMSQQRKRRFMSVWRKGQDKQHQPSWDSNIITPGTRFMKALDMSLDLFFKNNESKFKFKVQLSPSSEPGEGEHKIFDVMGSQDTVIYGLDADLILLSMISPNCDRIKLLRERPEFGSSMQASMPSAASATNEFIFLKIDQLIKAITEYFDIDSVNDYVMLSTLLGNDFLPPLSYLNIRDEGIEKVISAYKKCIPNTLLVGPAPTYDLNTILLGQIICELSRTETVHMDEACQKYYCGIPANKPISIDSYPQYKKHYPMIRPASSSNWQNIYYTSLFTQGLSVRSICEDYIDSILWVHAYYFTRDASRTWSYPHAYSPLAQDLTSWSQSDVTMCMKKIRSTDERTYNALLSNSVLQQLSVLPPCQTFDTRLSNIMNELKYGCVHLYPSHFHIHTFLKTYLWECVPMLPILGIQDIYKLHETSTMLSQNAEH